MLRSTKQNDIKLFPYRPRRYQREIVETIRECLEERIPLVLESGTGSGKTVCAVSQCLDFSINNDKKILYVTRTNAQQRQVITEARKIREVFPDTRENIFAVGVQGRAHTCLLARDDPELSKGSAEELARFCSEMKKGKRKKKCRYFEKLGENPDLLEDIKEWIREKLPTVEEIVERCRESKVCPYEINRMMIPYANLVVAPYIYVFDDNLRNLIIDLMGKGEEDIILVVDEAHNLPEYLRSLLSSYLSVYATNQCLSESERYGDPFIFKNLKLSEFLLVVRDVIDQIRGEFLKGNNHDALLPDDYFASILCERFDIREKDLRAIGEQLIIYGEEIKDIKQREGKLPRSYIHKLGVFLLSWLDIGDGDFVKLVVDETDGKNPRIEIYCLDASLAAAPIGKFYTSIHMSGTLSPLEEYRDSLNLPPDTKLVSFPSPFPKENRKIIYSPLVSTRYEEIKFSEEMINRIKDIIVEICNTFNRNIIVFFPSFELMNRFLDGGLIKDIKKTIYVERREMKQDELMETILKFKKRGSRGNVLLSVVGGRISEGMDFPAEELEIAIIVGIPYPKPTSRQKALQRYYDAKFGKGWEYAINAPTARKLLQSIGRLIRNETDRGIAIILDRRAPRFRKYLGVMKVSADTIRDIGNFLEED